VPEFDLLASLSSGTAPARALAARDEEPRCSRKACRTPARWSLTWRNPRIHTDGRSKTWLACDEHRAWLSDYLATRGLLLSVDAFASPSSDASPQEN